MRNGNKASCPQLANGKPDKNSDSVAMHVQLGSSSFSEAHQPGNIVCLVHESILFLHVLAIQGRWQPHMCFLSSVGWINHISALEVPDIQIRHIFQNHSIC